MWPFKKKSKVDYNDLISKLETGNEYELEKILWQPESGKINYQPSTFTALQKLKRSGSARGLSIYQQTDNGKFEMVTFNVPWISTGDKPFSPVIVDKTNGKIIGTAIPFSEIHTHLSADDSNDIVELGKIWLKFVMNV